jgi:DNA topoisomerase III
LILVIAEKPSVAQSIAKVLGATSRKGGYMEGGNYIVSWCFGHLVELADASSYDERYAKWRYDDLPIVPENWMFEVTKDKAQQFKVLSALMKDKRVTELVCATDAGREGELIFRLVYNKAGCTKPFKRLWISSLEDSAIREGFNHLRDGKEYDRLYEAALSRSKADWIVGINGTRLFTTLYHRKLVVGRVQTPTLAMLVERDGKISTFQKEKYFNVHVGKGDLTADLEKVKTEEEAKRIAAACEKKQAVVSSLKRETKTVNPPKLYDLTTLQREANRYYGFTAQQTLDLVQTLYEKKLLDALFQLVRDFADLLCIFVFSHLKPPFLICFWAKKTPSGICSVNEPLPQTGFLCASSDDGRCYPRSPIQSAGQTYPGAL